MFFDGSKRTAGVRGSGESGAVGDEDFGVASLVTDLGVVLVLPVLVGVAVGRWIDSQLRTLPGFTLALIGVGAVVGFVAMMGKALSVQKPKTKNK